MSVTNERYVLAGAPIHRPVGDEVFVLSADSRMHWMRNATASCVWEALVAAGARGMTLEELAAVVAARFEVSEEGARGDLGRFLGELEAAGLVGRAMGERGGG